MVFCYDISILTIYIYIPLYFDLDHSRSLIFKYPIEHHSHPMAIDPPHQRPLARLESLQLPSWHHWPWQRALPLLRCFSEGKDGGNLQDHQDSQGDFTSKNDDFMGISAIV